MAHYKIDYSITVEIEDDTKEVDKKSISDICESTFSKVISD